MVCYRIVFASKNTTLMSLFIILKHCDLRTIVKSEYLINIYLVTRHKNTLNYKIQRRYVFLFNAYLYNSMLSFTHLWIHFKHCELLVKCKYFINIFSHISQIHSKLQNTKTTFFFMLNRIFYYINNMFRCYLY